MTKSIRLVALDLDGTLLGPDLQIKPRTRAAVEQARARGVRVVIATGRMYRSAAPFAGALGLEQTPLIAYGGALVREYPVGQTLHHEPIPLEVCRRLATFCEAQGYHLQAYVDDQLYVPDIGRHTQDYVRIAQVQAHPVGALSTWLSVPSTKLLIVEEAGRMPQTQDAVQQLLGEMVNVAPSCPTLLEIVNSRVSKATALAAVARAAGIEADEVMAVGDAMNDLSMLTWAGVSFAINHAPEPLKRAATYVTESGAGEGVIEALRRMGLAD